MKYLLFIFTTIVLFANYSCKQKREVSDQLKLNADVENIINDYVKKHPQFNTFILQSTRCLERNENSLSEQGFLLGPGYESLLTDQPKLYFDVSDKRIFFISPIDELVQKSQNKWIIKNKADSLVLPNGWIIKNSGELFIHRSILFYYNEDGNLEVNLRPDTIFAPRLLESSVQFENIRE